MLDFGTTAAHGNSYDYGDLEHLDLTESYGVAIKLLPNTGAAVNQDFMGKSNVAGATGQGWFLRSGLSNHLIPRMWHNLTQAFEVAAAISTTEVSSLFFRWDKPNTTGYAHVLGQPEKVTTGISAVPTLHTMPFAVGAGGDDVDRGYACRVAHAMVWAGYFPNALERDLYHQGIFIPAPGKQVLHVPGINELAAGKDDQSNFAATGTEVGTVTAIGNDVDAMFRGLGVVLPNRQLAGYDLRLFACSPEVYKVIVPNQFQTIEIGDAIQLADGDIPTADSLRGVLADHFMLDDWRNIFGQVLEASCRENETEFTVLNLVPSCCFIWDTSALAPGEVVNDEQHGTAIFLPYGSMTNDRNSTHFIVDSTEENDEVRLSPVAQFAPKINHRGHRYEGEYTNILPNSAFLVPGAGPPTFDGWTETVAGGGTVSSVDESSGVRFLFRDKVMFNRDQRMCEIKQGSSGNSYVEGTTATTDSSGRAMITPWFQGAVKVAIQRASDSFYWNGAAWQASLVWLTDTSGITWKQGVVYIPTGVPSSSTLKVRLGANGLTDERAYFGQCMVVQDWALHTDLITLADPVTAGADHEKWNYDNAGVGEVQLFNPNVGGVRYRVRLPYDTSQIPNDTTLVVHSNYIDEDNHDTLMLRRLSSGTLRWEFLRTTGGLHRGFASLTSSGFLANTEKEVAIRWVSASNGELGLPARTISAFEDGVKGTDAAPGTLLDDTADETSVFVGSIPEGSHGLPGATVRPFEGILKNFELVQHAIADEAMLARRVAA